MNFQRLTILVLLTTMCFVARSQKLIHVQGVIKSIEGDVLPYAILKIDSSQFCTANNEGGYEIDVVPGKHSLELSYVGYARFVREVIIRRDTILIIQLTEQTNQLAEAVIEVDPRKAREEQGYAMNSIETEEYRSQSVELNDVLSQSTGIAVRQSGGLGSRVNYSLNGLKGKAIRFFLDGVPMDYFSSSFSVNTLPVSLIDRIDVYKGVVPAELGNDALGGAINIVTHKSRDNGGELAYSYGSFNTHRFSGYGFLRDSASGFTAELFTFYNHSDNNYEVWGDDIYATNPSTYMVERDLRVERFHDAFTSKAAKVNIGFTNKHWADQIYVGLIGSGMDKEIQHGPTMEVPYGEASYHQKVLMPHLVYKKYDIIKGLDINVFGSYSNLTRSRVDTSINIYNWYGEIEGERTLGGEQTRTLNELNEEVWLSRINMVYHFNDHHRLVLNNVLSDLTREENDPLLTSKNEGYWAPQLVHKNVFSLAYRGEVLEKKLKYSLFYKNFRYRADVKVSEYQDGALLYRSKKLSDFSNGYGVALSYKPVSWMTIMGSTERTSRLPEADEILGDGLNVLYTDSLRPEKSLNINAGFRLDLLENKRDRFTTTTNFFYRDVEDHIQQYQYDMGAFVYINFDDVRMTGIDFSCDYNFRKRIKLSASVSYLNPVFKSKTDESGNAEITYDTRLPNTVFFTQNTSIRFHFEDVVQKKSLLFVYWSVHYVGGFYRHSEIIGEHNKDMIPAQLVNSCGIGYRFPKQKVSISIDAKNLFDEQVFDNYAIQKPGRSMFVKGVYMF